MKQRLETLLGERPVAPVDRTQQQRVKEERDQLAERQAQLVTAGQQVVSAVCQLVSAVLPASAAQPDDAVVQEVRGGLESLVRHDEQGRPQLQLTLPDNESLNQLATTLARLIGLTRPAT